MHLEANSSFYQLLLGRRNAPHLATTPFHIFSKLALSESQTEVLAADQESNQAYEIMCGCLYLGLDADPEEPDCMVLLLMVIV